MRTVIVLGATGCVGDALCRKLVAAGDRVVMVGRNHEKLAPLAAALGQAYVVDDLRSSSSLETAVRSIVEPKDVVGVANCVGSILLKSAHLTSDEEFRGVLETNLFTAFVAVRLGANLMAEQGGSIVLFASAAAKIGLPNHEAIAAAKAGVAGLARSAAATYARRNIRVNAVSPGLVKSEMSRRIWDNSAAAQVSLAMHALRRFGEPQQVAELVAWLLRHENDWITGQDIACDGGLSTLASRA